MYMEPVKISIPLLIRLLEFAREDSKTDMDLHFIAEQAAELGKSGTLTMKDYASILKTVNSKAS